MEELVTKILISVIHINYQDTRREKVCRIFIPGDTRMFNKFGKILKKQVDTEWRLFKQEGGSKAVAVVENAWFHRYLQYQTSVQDVYDYVVKNGKMKADENVFLEMLTEQASEYAVDCGAGVCETNSVLVFQDKAALTAEDKECIRKFYGMVLRVVYSVIEEITPKVERLEKVDLKGTEEEIRAQVIHNLREEKLKSEEMWWHIRYCIEHEVNECSDIMVNLAKNGQWKSWVRQAAAEYNCRFMDVGEFCEKLLPGLYGKLFYWTITQFADTQDEWLKTLLKDHAEYYTGQEMLQDICLVKMQDKDGTKRICRYLERMRHVSRAIENPDPVLVISEIKSVKLLDELGRLLDLVMRDNFRDRSYSGLQTALAAALSGVASAGEEEYGKVTYLLDEKLEYYHRQYKERMDIVEKRKRMKEAEENSKAEIEKERAEVESARTAAERLAMLMCLNEDVRWRCRHMQLLKY